MCTLIQAVHSFRLTIFVNADVLKNVTGLQANWEKYMTQVVNNLPIVADPILIFPRISETVKVRLTLRMRRHTLRQHLQRRNNLVVQA